MNKRIAINVFIIFLFTIGMKVSKPYEFTDESYRRNINYNFKPNQEYTIKLELNKKTQIFKSTQGVNFCGYKINEYRLKIRTKGKKKLKEKIKKLKYQIKTNQLSTKEAYKYLAGHLGYIDIANVKNLKEKLFYIE